MMGLQKQLRDAFFDIPDEDAKRLVGELYRRYEKTEMSISRELAGAHYYYLYLDRAVRQKLIADGLRAAYEESKGDVDKAFELYELEDQRRLKKLRIPDGQSLNGQSPIDRQRYSERR